MGMDVGYLERVDMIGNDLPCVNVDVARLPLSEMVVQHRPKERQKEKQHRDDCGPTQRQFFYTTVCC